MEKEKTIEYIESSFLASLISDRDVTDISYNGSDFFYVSNTKGRMRSSMSVEHQLVKDFLRQIANLSEQQFSFSNPVLDISIGKYRINAVHQSIGKIKDNDVVTFSIRIASEKPRIDNNSDFFTPQIVELLKELLINRQSIVIGGLTSSGKTEFQKYLLRSMRINERIIVIDNVTELDSVRDEDNIDLTCWRVDERNEFSSCSLLIKNALRNNPDWLILAEARGKEMFDDNPSEGVNLVPGTQEDVIEEIKAFYTESPNSTVTFIKEEDECWYFNDSEGNDYMYCFSNPEVIKLEKKTS